MYPVSWEVVYTLEPRLDAWLILYLPWLKKEQACKMGHDPVLQLLPSGHHHPSRVEGLLNTAGFHRP